MKYVYRVTLSKAPEGGFTAVFPDFAGAVTQGDTRADTLTNATDALLAMLAMIVANGHAVPIPSGGGGPTVVVPPLAAAKIALYRAMHDAGMSKVELARRLGVTEGAVRKLLNPNHRSHIDKVSAALALFGREIEVHEQAA
ncbi:MAG: hypothetical protein VW057_14275 [Rhodospirillaceae bacterium]